MPFVKTRFRYLTRELVRSKMTNRIGPNLPGKTFKTLSNRSGVRLGTNPFGGG